MLLVLVVHADFFSLGVPDTIAFENHPISSFSRFITQSLSLVCVNVFIIISGYFKIRLKRNSVLNLLFMVFFWRVIVIVSYLAFRSQWPSDNPVSMLRLIKMLIPGYDDWFVGAYILLMILSPLLNSFIERCGSRQLWGFAIAYCLFQFMFEWIAGIYNQFNNGYSVLSFMGLYILGAAIHRYPPKTCSTAKKSFGMYLAIAITAGALAACIIWRFGAESHIGTIMRRIFEAYNGAGVVLSSLFLFLTFGHLSFKSRQINMIAESAFAVYLFHMHPLIRPIYAGTCRHLYESYDTWTYLPLISAFIIGTFIFSVIVDAVRKYIWLRFSSLLRSDKFMRRPLR